MLALRFAGPRLPSFSELVSSLELPTPTMPQQRLPANSMEGCFRPLEMPSVHPMLYVPEAVPIGCLPRDTLRDIHIKALRDALRDVLPPREMLSPFSDASCESPLGTPESETPEADKLPGVGTKRKHVCKTCARSFTTLGHLARHNRTHTGERKHVCPWPQCGARFARQDNCMQHCKTHLNGKSKRNRLRKT